MVDVDHAKRIQTPADVLGVDHQKVYGRPYWSSLSDSEVVKAASEKLFFRRYLNPKDAGDVLAALAARIGLEIGPGEASMRLPARAVSRHMQILKGVVDQLVVTTSPPEPMLAIAAAQALNSSSNVYRPAIETLVDKLILRGCVLDCGLQGELYSRLLFTLARDQATTLTNGNSFVKTDPGEVPRLRAVRADLFLTALLGPDLGIPYSVPPTTDMNLCTRLLEDMSEVSINFTHFVHLTQPINEISSSNLLEAWSSCFAFQCAFNQPVIGGFLVAYRGELHEPFDVDKLFMIPWQTTVKSRTDGLDHAQQLTTPLIVTTELKTGRLIRKKTEHLAIFMDLNAGGRVQLGFAKAEGSNWGGYRKNIEPKRYCLHVRGYGSDECPALEGFEEPFGKLFQRSIACEQPKIGQFGEAMEVSMQRINLDT